MKIAIVYQSLTGNTEILANSLNKYFGEQIVYFGGPKNGIQADLFFIGSGTLKGMCTPDIEFFLKSLQNVNILYFGTAGFGGSSEYYDSLYKRILNIIPIGNKVNGYFFCQGKMDSSVRDKYLNRLKENSDDSITLNFLNNFENAKIHPDLKDIQNIQEWAGNQVVSLTS